MFRLLKYSIFFVIGSVLLITESFSQAQLSSDEMEKVITLVQGNKYIKKPGTKLYGENYSMFGGSQIHYFIDEIPLEASKLKKGKYMVDATRYILSEENYNNSSCDKKYMYSCRLEKKSYYKLSSDPKLKVNPEILKSNYVEISQDFNEKEIDNLMDFISIPLPEIAKNKDYFENKKDWEFACKIILKDQKKYTNIRFKPLFIYKENGEEQKQSSDEDVVIMYNGYVDEHYSSGVNVSVKGSFHKKEKITLKFSYPGIA